MKKYIENKHAIKYFDEISDEYEDHNESTLEFLTRLKKMASPYIQGDVLDIGSGGIVSFDIAKAKTITLGDVAVGLLKNPKVVNNNKFELIDKKKNRLHCVEASVMNLPFKDNSFDTVVMFKVAHHLSVPSLLDSKNNAKRAMSEIYRVLRKNGTLLLLEDCPTPIFKFILDTGYNFWYWLLYKLSKKPLPYFLSEKQINKYLVSEGFKIRQVKSLVWSKRNYQPLFPWFSPPGWLWEMVLQNRFFIVKK